MAESTRDIKRRIKSIGSTKQITNAMELVSSSKMRKARIKLEESRPYYLTILSSIRNVINYTNVNHPLLSCRPPAKALYIVVTADRGLAGGYNSNINRLVHSKFQDKKSEISLITIGRKARDFFKRRDYEILEEFIGISEDPLFSDAREIGNLAIDLFKEAKIDEINLVYTKFVTTLSYEPTILKILPTEEIAQGSIERNRVIDFEPSPEEVLDYLIPKYVQSVIYGALIEASASEQSARRVAMDAATENAQEMIDDLNMSYNRARQAAITMEISEIVTGAEALK